MFDFDIFSKHEVSFLKPKGYTHIVSLQDPGCKPILIDGITDRLDLICYDTKDTDPIPNSRKPQLKQAKLLVNFLRNIPNGSKVLFHCHAGISRSTAAAFIFARIMGLGQQEAMDLIERKRPCLWPNEWIIKLCDKLTGQDNYSFILNWKKQREDNLAI